MGTNCCPSKDANTTPKNKPEPHEPPSINPIVVSPNFFQIDTLREHDGKITCIKELKNKNIISGSNEGELKLWNLNKMMCESTIKMEGQILCILEFEPNMILLGKSTNDIELWNIKDILNSVKIHSFEGHEYWVIDLAKCDSRYFASASNDGDIRIWDYYNKICLSIISNENNINFLCLITLKNGKLCSGDADSSIKIWDWKNKKCEDTKKGHSNYVKCLCELEEGGIASGSDDTTIMIWKKNEEPPYVLKQHTKAVRYICQIKKYFIASASFDHTVKIWNLYYKSCIQTLNGHYNFVTGVILHSNGQLISCSNDKTIILWMEGNAK